MKREFILRIGLRTCLTDLDFITLSLRHMDSTFRRNPIRIPINNQIRHPDEGGAPEERTHRGASEGDSGVPRALRGVSEGLPSLSGRRGRRRAGLENDTGSCAERSTSAK